MPSMNPKSDKNVFLVSALASRTLLSEKKTEKIQKTKLQGLAMHTRAFSILGPGHDSLRFPWHSTGRDGIAPCVTFVLGRIQSPLSFVLVPLFHDIPSS